MDAVSYSHADKQKQRIEKFIKQPDSTSGIVTVPDTIASGESIEIATGRQIVVDHLDVQGTLDIQGTLATVSGGYLSQTTMKTEAITHTNGTNAMTIDSSGNVMLGSNYLTPYTGFKNRIINGDMRIDQRGSATTPATSAYGVDRFSLHPTTGAVTWGQVTDAPAGFINSSKWTVTSAASPAAGAYNMVRQIIEGVNIADLGWGTANAKTVTLSFWVKASITGTYGIGLINSAEDTSYVAEYTISSANTWEYKTIYVPGATSGTWLTNNSNGIRCAFDLGSGTNYNGTAGVWQSGWKQRTSGCVTPIGTNGATFYITGIQLEKGSVATPFEQRPYGTELALCQRYYQKNARFAWTNVATGNWNSSHCAWKVTMRASPTVITYSTVTGASGKIRYQDGNSDVNSYLPSNSIDGSAVGVNNVTTNAGSNMFAIVTADAEL